MYCTVYSCLITVYLSSWIGKLYYVFTVQLPEYGLTVYLDRQALQCMYTLQYSVQVPDHCLPVYLDRQAVQWLYSWLSTVYRDGKWPVLCPAIYVQ